MFNKNNFKEDNSRDEVQFFSNDEAMVTFTGETSDGPAVESGLRASNSSEDKSIDIDSNGAATFTGVLVSSEDATESSSDFERLVEETLKGKHGTGRERMISLGTNYAKVQMEVNRRIRLKK